MDSVSGFVVRDFGGVIRPSAPLGFVALQALRGAGAPRMK